MKVQAEASAEAGAAAAGTAPSHVPGVHSAASKATAVQEEAEELDAMKVQAEAAVEMEPDLEALLSTLTPLQILLLDKNTNIKVLCHDNSTEHVAREQNHESTGRPEEQGAELSTLTDGGQDETAASPLAGIDPLQIVGDLTTEHRARVLLSSLLSPSGVTLHDFYARYWGKRPLLCCLDQAEEEQRSHGVKDETRARAAALRHATRLNGFLDRPLIEKMIEKNKLRYSLDLNVTRFTDSAGDGVRRRITLDAPPKRRGDEMEYVVAHPADVWSNVDGSRCTLRLLRPHEHRDEVHALLSLLESELGCMIGANSYLTPLHAQGFAPHYDDVDVFLLQLEGYKRWRVYAPFHTGEALPRSSSRDYTEREVEERAAGGEPLMDVVLRPAESHPRLPGRTDEHSLHLTVSAMQNWSWADFLETLIPEALQDAVNSDKNLSLREGLPRNFVGYMGTMHQPTNEDPEGLKQVVEAQDKRLGQKDPHSEDLDDEAALEAQLRHRDMARRTLFRNEAKKRLMRVCKHALSMLDDAADRIGTRFLSDRLPPALLASERRLTKAGRAAMGGALRPDAAAKVWPNTLCRLARQNTARLVVEGDKAIVYHCFDNSRVFHGNPLSPLEFEVDDAPALEQLLTTVEPHWIMVKDLIHGDVEDKMEIAQALFDEGILATMLADTPDRSIQVG